MRLKFSHLLLLSLGSSSLGVYLLWHIYPEKGRGCFEGASDSSAGSLMSLIRTSDPSFQLANLTRPDNTDVLCWMNLTRRGSPTPPLSGVRFRCRVPNTTSVPNIVFYCIFGTVKFSFLNYISFLSVNKFVRPPVIYVVGDREPWGPWWRRATRDMKNVQYVYRGKVYEIFGVELLVREHIADVVRLQILLLSGGLYIDTDIIILKPLDYLWKYDVTMGLIDKNTGMGNGFIMAKPYSKFLTYWYESYKNFNNSKWGYHSMHHPHLLSQVFPNLINVEKKYIYSPNWYEVKKLFLQIVPWADNIAMHIWHRVSKFHLPSKPSEIDHLNTTLGEVLRYIYYGKKNLR